MKSVRPFQQKLERVFRCWNKQEYEGALKIVEELLEEWPGNAQLVILWANLVQLQDKTGYSLDGAKHALHRAIVLEKDYPTGHIELGHFLDAVEDDPKNAVGAYAAGIEAARQHLIDGLLGQAKAFVQLRQRESALKCLMELLYLHRMAYGSEEETSRDRGVDFLIKDAEGWLMVGQVKAHFPDKVKELIQELFPKRSA